MSSSLEEFEEAGSDRRIPFPRSRQQVHRAPKLFMTSFQECFELNEISEVSETSEVNEISKSDWM